MSDITANPFLVCQSQGATPEMAKLAAFAVIVSLDNDQVWAACRMAWRMLGTGETPARFFGCSAFIPWIFDGEITDFGGLQELALEHIVDTGASHV